MVQAPALGQPTCINLQERFGDRYRVRWEADGATKEQWPRDEWPWLMEMRGRYGVIYPQGGEILAACTDGARVGARLRALPCVRTVRGDAETVVTFEVQDAEEVFVVLKPYRRRRVSAARRQHLRAIGAAGRYRKGGRAAYRETSGGQDRRSGNRRHGRSASARPTGSEARTAVGKQIENIHQGGGGRYNA